MFDALKTLDEIIAKVEETPDFMQLPILAMLIDCWCYKHDMAMADVLNRMANANKEIVAEMGNIGLERED